jgi:ribokinase
MAQIVVIGSLNMDIIATCPRLPQRGETVMGTGYLNEPGGKGANQAYAASRLGADVAMLGRVGGDEHGKHLCANLAAVGCDVSGVQALQGSSGVAVIYVGQSGENCIVVVPGANARYLPADLDTDDRCWANVEFALLQLEIPVDTVIQAARVAKDHGAQVILDPAPVLPSLPPELLRHVDILTPNEIEASQLAGGRSGALSWDEARAIAKQLQAMGPGTVIVKLGAQGCLVAEGEVVTLVPAPHVDVVDTTAAGDVFNAALAVARTDGVSMLEACCFAVRAAAFSVTRLGAQRSMPSRADLNAFSGAKS